MSINQLENTQKNQRMVRWVFVKSKNGRESGVSPLRKKMPFTFTPIANIFTRL